MNTCSGETLPQSDEGDGNGAPAGDDDDDDVDDADAGDGDGSDGGSDSSGAPGKGEDATKHGKDEEYIIWHLKLICLMKSRPS